MAIPSAVIVRCLCTALVGNIGSLTPETNAPGGDTAGITLIDVTTPQKLVVGQRYDVEITLVS